MMEAERLPARGRQFTPVVQGFLKQDEGADDVCLDESGRTIDGTIDVAFRRQMDHHLGPEFLQRRAYPAAKILHERIHFAKCE